MLWTDEERERVRVTGAASVLIRSGDDEAAGDCEAVSRDGSRPESRSQGKALAQDKVQTRGKGKPGGLLN